MTQLMKQTSIALLSSAGALALLLTVSAPLTVTPAQATVTCSEDSDCEQNGEGMAPEMTMSGEDSSEFSGEGKDSSGGGDGGPESSGGSSEGDTP